MKNMNKKELLIVLFSLILSIISGVISKDLLIGGSILFTSLLCSYYASIGKKVSYIFGIINYLIMAYVFFENNLYGLFFFSIFIFMPLNISGFINWKNNQDEDENVKVKEFTFKNSIIIVSSCIIGSLILGYLLTLIPNQNLAYMDATSNCINLCGVILMALRFKEAWWVWFLIT